MKSLRIGSLIAIFFNLIFLFSCGSSDSDEVNPNADESVVSEVAAIQSEVNEVVSYTNDAIDNGTGKAKLDFSFCASLSHNPDTKTIILDFGDSGCGINVIRTGKITITYLGDPQSQGNRTIEFTNYTVNGNAFSGTITISNIKTNNEDNPEMTISLGNIVFVSGDNKTTNLTSTQTFEWTEGIGNLNPLDDVIEITGSSQGTTSDGNSFTLNISSALVYKSDCVATKNPYPVSGTQNINPSGSSAFSIDYGDGLCDKKATITIGNFSNEVDLP